ncbi:MAG: hypothetical protein ACYC6F_10685 [Longimicrobiales bacterium]
MRRSLVLVAAFVAILPTSTLAQKLTPCGGKKRVDALPIPSATRVAAVAGHEFRKADVCVPVLVRTEWKNRYDGFEHRWYEVSAREMYPGELWYRTDTEEFVIVASGLTYSGQDALLSISARGEACHNDAGGRCNKWTAFGADDVVAVELMGSKTGAFLYGWPTVVTLDEEIPSAVSIRAPLFEFHRSPELYSRPPMVDIDNPALFDADPLTYPELVTASRQRRPVSRTIRWAQNERTDEESEHAGTLTLEISFSPTCPSPFRIVAPEADTRLVFSEATPGEVTIEAHAGDFVNMPPDLIELITWSAPEKAGAQVSYEPASRQGPDIRITYTGLPERNRDFGPTEITASLDVGGPCGTLTSSQTVRLFFPRDAWNNPAVDVPNYYYYWIQTPAGQGAVPGQDVRYMHRSAECGEDPKWLGYHPRETVLSVPSDPLSQPRLVGRDHIYLCDFHKYDNAYPAHPSTDFYMEGTVDPSLNWEGIDAFAVIVLHELTHRQHWRDWWNPTGGYPKQGYYDANNNRQRDPAEPWLDQDEDFMPDAREGGLGYDTGVKNTFNTPGEEMYDEHHLTYTVGEKWQKGSADRVDWAKPGKQWR